MIKMTVKVQMVHDVKLYNYYVDILGHCAAEKCMIEQFPLQTVQWIACDICKKWFHKYCCHLSEKANPRYFKCKEHQ